MFVTNDGTELEGISLASACEEDKAKMKRDVQMMTDKIEAI